MATKEPITNDTIVTLAEKGRLDGNATSELLKWSDEHLKSLTKGMGDLERKMHIMLAIDLAILYLIFREGGNSAPQFALSASYADCVSLLWRIFLTAVLAITGFAMVCFGRGLLVPAPFGVPGTRLINWGTEYLTVLSNGPNGENKEKNVTKMRGFLCVQYSDRIQQSAKTHQKKLRLYRRGLNAHWVLLGFILLGACAKIWGSQG